MVTVDSDTLVVAPLTSVRPGLIWLSVGDESLFLYCARSVPGGGGGVDGEGDVEGEADADGEGDVERDGETDGEGDADDVPGRVPHTWRAPSNNTMWLASVGVDWLVETPANDQSFV